MSRLFHNWIFTKGKKGSVSADTIVKEVLVRFDIPYTDECCPADADAENLTNRELTTSITTLTTLTDGIASGTSTPTITSGANTASTATPTGRYLRVGDQVTFSGTLSVTPTLTATTTVVEISLPVASNFAATSDASGSGTAVGTSIAPISIIGSIANDRLVVSFTSSGTGAHVVTFNAVYTVI